MATLFGRKVSLLDAAAGAIALAALAGVVWSPKLSNRLARATGSVKPVLVHVDARNLPLADPDAFVRSAREDQRLSLIVRNQLSLWREELSCVYVCRVSLLKRKCGVVYLIVVKQPQLKRVVSVWLRNPLHNTDIQ